MKLELIAFNIQSCIDAQAAGANRIELCDNPDEGGTTPSYGFIKAARDVLTIDLYPIIRPRGGDFLYSDAEFEIMKSDIKVCKVFGCNGISTGILKADGTIDKVRCKELADLAKPMKVTFHRAFDRVNDFNKALEDIIEIGCERVLTSGGKPNVADALETLSGLVKQAGDRIIIMPGSGVRSENIQMIAAKTGAKEFHSSARKMMESKMNFTNANMKENLQFAALDIEEAKRINLILKQGND
ncbi:MAG TPA: copper homeostasis protein CutC [Ferruginibacter sp.]|nr:copper homeostasis protein CutC [Ferruginibacter sp.]HRE62191.1 copper homeostasis protein CutC [Ferruginibacter sp.]